MWGIATFTMLVSSSSNTDASETVMAIRYRYLYRSPAPESTAPAGNAAVAMRRLLGRDGDVHAHSRPQRMCRIVGPTQPDAHRDAPHDLGEGSRRVVGRQHGEFGPHPRRQALHAPGAC